MVDFKAVDLDGSNESLRSNTATGTLYSFDIANTWTVTVTYKLASVAGTQTIWHLNDADYGDNDNTIMIEARDNDIRLLIVGSAGYGSPSKMFEYYNLLSAGDWHQTTVTWDGSAQTLNLYQDGQLHAASGTVINDPALTMTNSVDKSLWIGANKDTFSREAGMRVHSSAIWNSVLSASRIATITGAATEDLSDARHWWRLGFDPTTTGLGNDYGSSATKININQASSQVTAADVVTDYPGM